MSNYNYDFDTECMRDDGVEEMIDGLLLTVAEQIAEENSYIEVANPKRIQHVIYTYKMLKYVIKGSKAKVTYTLHEPYQSMGAVSIIGSNLSFVKTKWFMVAAKLASNLDIYPKTDGTVQMDFTFHGLTNQID